MPDMTMTDHPQSNGDVDLVADYPPAPVESSPTGLKRKRLESESQPQTQTQLYQDLWELLKTSVASINHHLTLLVLTSIIAMIPNPQS